MDEDAPITPITGPNIDAEGRLTYMGEDGRRYVVMDGDERDETSSAAVMEALRSAGPLFEEIETLCQGWVDEVSDAALTQGRSDCVYCSPPSRPCWMTRTDTPVFTVAIPGLIFDGSQVARLLVDDLAWTNREFTGFAGDWSCCFPGTQPSGCHHQRGVRACLAGGDRGDRGLCWLAR